MPANRSRKQRPPVPRILSAEDCRRILGAQTFRDAVKAGWLKHKCEKQVPRGPKRQLFDRLDVEQIEEKILSGIYPQ